MRRLYLIGGTMGVGKTTACQILKKRLPNCVFLDGDWCWDMDPFKVTDETKAMVTGNICYLLNSFLRCGEFENVVFCWVMHEQAIIDGLLSRIELNGASVVPISLVCGEKALRLRLGRDVEAGIRGPDVIERSVARIPMYQCLNTVKLDVSSLTPEQTADAIVAINF